MRIYCLSLLLPVMLGSCSHLRKDDCNMLKNGQFYYKSKLSFSGSMIMRNDSIQIVTDGKTGEKQKQKIEWIDPCTYMLYPFSDNKDDSLNPDLFPIKVRVLDVTKKYYTVHISSEHYKADFNDTVWIVRLLEDSNQSSGLSNRNS